MNQFFAQWTALSLRRKIISIGAAIAVFAAVLMMARLASQPRLTLLYAQLEQTAAGDVVRALDQRNVAYEVRGGAIFVDASERDALRLTLAAEGLPANGPQGYELLDTLTGFGTTSQMFDAAYWRAKEGELARTILASPGVSGARVHIAQSAVGAFQRDAGASASVFLTSTSGTIDPDLARAMRYLVASAVPRLSPDGVSIIDSVGRLISGDAGAPAAATAEDRTGALRDRVQRIVEARVGKGNAVVEVSVDTVSETESIFERRFDPEGRVAISTDTEESNRESEDSGGGLTVASNLPDGDAGGNGGRSQNNETRERVNYEVSETTREIIRAAGSVKRVSVAVLVNGTRSIGDDGQQVFSPLPEPEIEALRDLVASAVGFDDARGDQITIRSLAFEETSVNGTAAIVEPWYARGLDVMSLVQMAVLGLVALLLGLFVVRPILAGQSAAAQALPPPAGAAAGGALAELSDAAVDPGFDMASPDDLPMLVGSGGDFGAGFGLDDAEPGDPIDRLRGLIDSRRDETVEVLRAWLDDKEQA